MLPLNKGWLIEFPSHRHFSSVLMLNNTNCWLKQPFQFICIHITESNHPSNMIRCAIKHTVLLFYQVVPGYGSVFRTPTAAAWVEWVCAARCCRSRMLLTMWKHAASLGASPDCCCCCCCFSLCSRVENSVSRNLFSLRSPSCRALTCPVLFMACVWLRVWR